MRNGWNWKYPLSYMYPAHTQLLAKWSSPSFRFRTQGVEWVKVLIAFGSLCLWQCLGRFSNNISKALKQAICDNIWCYNSIIGLITTKRSTGSFLSLTRRESMLNAHCIPRSTDLKRTLRRGKACFLSHGTFLHGISSIEWMMAWVSTYWEEIWFFSLSFW